MKITDCDRIDFLQSIIDDPNDGDISFEVNEYNKLEFFTCTTQFIEGKTIRSVIDKAIKMLKGI